jgi:hypothetical protein
MFENNLSNEQEKEQELTKSSLEHHPLPRFIYFDFVKREKMNK